MSKPLPILKPLLLCALAVLCPALWSCSAEDTTLHTARYTGMSDASAAVALDAYTFMVADDEENTLRVYRRDPPGPPLQEIPWDVHLGIDPQQDEHPEVDVEGATVLDGRIYWISSHGRNKDGRWRPNRHRFFAITLEKTAGRLVAKPFGKAYHDLAVDLAGDKRLQDLGLAKALAMDQPQVEALAPKRKGLNIEGLSAAADGKSLLIAFRNPRGHDGALLVPLENPAAVLADGARPQFGTPIQLQLTAKIDGKRRRFGVRGIEYSPRHAAYLIAAGPPDEKTVSAVYRWSGAPDQQPQLLKQATQAVNDLEDFTPETIVVYPGEDKIQLLSDDGALPVRVRSPAECLPDTFHNGYCEAKYLRDKTRKTFRGILIDVE
jgi:hypothetical protein